MQHWWEFLPDPPRVGRSDAEPMLDRLRRDFAGGVCAIGCFDFTFPRGAKVYWMELYVQLLVVATKVDVNFAIWIAVLDYHLTAEYLANTKH